MMLFLSEEQQLLEASALSFLGKEYDFQSRRLSLTAPHGCSPSVWNHFANMGWLALPLPARVGGFGGGPLSTGLLLQALGRHLAIEPFHACIVLAARVLAELGTDDQCDAWMPAIMEGRSRVALAHDEISQPAPWAARHTRAHRCNDGWTLHGSKLLAIGAPGAQSLLVSASVWPPGGVAPEQRLFLVSPGTPGLVMSECRTSDGSRAADITLDGVKLDAETMLGDDRDIAADLYRLHAEALIGLCWEACGAMTAAYEQTAAYTQQRTQFGQSLSQFQVVAHGLAETAVRCVEARAACELASLRLECADGDALCLASMAKNKVGRCADLVAKHAVQLHGAIGISEELPIASYFRKLAAFIRQGGTSDWHAQRFGQDQLRSGAWRNSQTLPPDSEERKIAKTEQAIA